MNDAIKMQISAFVDGELPDNESELLLRRLSQDIELRQQAARYYAISRAIRGQRAVQGSDKLRERIAAAIDDKSLQDEFDAIEPAGRRFLRPVTGVAIAVSVALVAILGVRQIGGVAGDNAPADLLADDADIGGYVVPPADYIGILPTPVDALWQYRAIHSSGASNIDARLAPLQRREDALADTEDDDAEDAPDSARAPSDAADQQTP